jgi:streptogrisin C
MRLETRMQRRGIIVAAAMVTATGAAVAFTLPSMADTTSGGRAEAPASTARDVAPQVLDAMKRDLGLDGEEARTRLNRQQWAAKVTSTLRARTGGAYAGAWLAEDGTTLNVAVTDSAMADEVAATGARPKLVEHSEQDLDAAKRRLDDNATRADRQLPGWYVDVADNTLVVLANPGETSRGRALAEDAGLDADAVTVRTTTSQPKPLFDVRGADPYFINVGGGTARCSIGFSVEGGFVTAGHCGEEGATTTGFNQQAQGTVVASTFPGDADMGVVEVNGDWTPRPVVNDFDGNELPVAGNTEAPVGAAVCRSGSTTGTRCGVILAKNQTVNYPEGAVTGLTRTDVCAEGGDSGGPWLAGDQAQGVTSGGSGNCTVGGETFFQPINEILTEHNLTLLTTGNAGDEPPAGDEGAGGAEEGGAGDGGAEDGGGADAQAVDCAALPVSRNGALSKAGNAQAQPNGGAFRAAAGELEACLDAPAGADFDLFLQQLGQNGFRTVAKATGSGDKQLTFSGGAGTYRYVVAAAAGNGSYALGFATP